MLKNIYIYCMLAFPCMCIHLHASDRNNLNTLIVSSLRERINLEKSYSFLQQDEHDTFYVSLDECPLLFDSLNDDRLINVKFLHLNRKELSETFSTKKLHEGIKFLCLRQLELHNNQLVITIASNVVTLKRRALNITISSWSTFVYEYSCSKKEWLLVKSDHGGI